MKTETPQPVYRKDYRQPDHWIESVDLEFDLREDVTTVVANLRFRCNDDVGDGAAPLVLDGEEITLRSVELDGKALGADEYEVSKTK